MAAMMDGKSLVDGLAGKACKPIGIWSLRRLHCWCLLMTVAGCGSSSGGPACSGRRNGAAGRQAAAGGRCDIHASRRYAWTGGALRPHRCGGKFALQTLGRRKQKGASGRRIQGRYKKMGPPGRQRFCARSRCGANGYGRLPRGAAANIQRRGPKPAQEPRCQPAAQNARIQAEFERTINRGQSSGLSVL